MKELIYGPRDEFGNHSTNLPCPRCGHETIYVAQFDLTGCDADDCGWQEGLASEPYDMGTGTEEEEARWVETRREYGLPYFWDRPV